MPGWLIGAALLLLLLFLALRFFLQARPSDLAQALRTFAAVFATLASTGLLFTGRFGLAIITIAAAGMAVRSVIQARRGADPLRDGPDDPDRPAVETALLRMELDRRTGRIAGTVRRGPHAGQSLQRLGRSALLELLAEAQREDPPSVDLLETYLDREHPGWRDDGGAERHPPPSGNTGTMDEATALAILGLKAGAAEEEIKAAHRKLMGRIHPDHGGSTFLASQINQAKDVLLRRSARR
jgi:hypothetical protein